MSRQRRRGPISLYFDYLPTYRMIQENPKARHYMQRDPGVKWMRRANRIVLFILFLIYLLGTYYA